MRIREGHRIKALPKAMRAMRLHLKPYLGTARRPVLKADLRDVRDALIDADTITAVNRLLASLGPVLRWAAEEDLISVNFVPAIRRTKEAKRERKLSKPEIQAIWKACDKLGPHDVAINYGRLVRFLLITAQRRDEAASLKLRRHPRRHLAAGREQGEPPAQHSLATAGEDTGRAGRGARLCFRGRLGKIEGVLQVERLLDEASGVTDWRLHDLRRTAASNMQELGIRNEVVQAILNHAVPGVGGIYLRSELEEEKADALAIWATRSPGSSGRCG